MLLIVPTVYPESYRDRRRRFMHHRRLMRPGCYRKFSPSASPYHPYRECVAVLYPRPFCAVRCFWYLIVLILEDFSHHLPCPDPHVFDALRATLSAQKMERYPSKGLPPSAPLRGCGFVLGHVWGLGYLFPF